MGNTIKVSTKPKQPFKSPYGSIFVRTDKTHYFSGEIVQGKVCLDIIEFGFPGNSIYIIVKGLELCQWEEKRSVHYRNAGQQTRRTKTDHHHGLKQFYCHKVLLHKFDDQYLPQGQYVLPFKFTLQSNLPSSFNQIESTWKGSITYKITIEIQSSQANINNLKHCQDLIVRETIKNQPQTLQKILKFKTKTWCCLNQGETRIKCGLDKINYLAGDQAYFWVQIDNSDCQMDVLEIKVALNQKIVIRSDQGREHFQNKILATEKMIGIQSHFNDSNQKTIQMVLRNSIGNTTDHLLKPSTKGSIVQSQYYLSATAIMKGCTCNNVKPSVRIPIQIVAPVADSLGEVQKPLNWNPQTFETIQFIFQDNNMYEKNSKNNHPSQNQKINALNQNNVMTSILPF